MTKIVVEALSLFDGLEVVEDASVLVEGERIVAVGSRGQFRGASARVLEAEFLMPGLIDMHVHVLGYTEDFRDPFKPIKSFLNLLLYNGVTAVRDVGNYMETKFFVEKWARDNPSPLFYTSGPILDGLPLRWPHSRPATSPEEARAHVERLHLEGADLIKAYVGIGPEVLRAVVEEAHRRGLRVAGHLGAAGTAEASGMGVDTLEHVGTLIDESYIDAEVESGEGFGEELRKLYRVWSLVDLKSERVEGLVQTLAENQTYVCPTLLVMRRMAFRDEGIEDPNLDYMVKVMPYHKYYRYMRNPVLRLLFSRYARSYDPTGGWGREDRRAAAAALEKMARLTGMLSGSGVRIIAGTDSPNPFIVPGFSLHQELGLLVESGLTPLEALRSATSTAAEALGEERLGTIRRGAVANLLLVSGNPAKNIADLANIDYVVLRGRPLRRDEIGGRI